MRRPPLPNPSICPTRKGIGQVPDKPNSSGTNGHLNTFVGNGEN
jgi:hypothetical protein